MRIMIVEDEQFVARDIEKMLCQAGYVVTSIASSAGDAVQKAAEDRPDLVLMDIMLQQGMMGIEAAREIRERLDIPVIFITAYINEETIKASKAAEPFGYLLKPVNEKELRASVELAWNAFTREKKVRERIENRYQLLEEELNRSREELRSLSQHLQSVREEESKRIAREIHDELGQALTALKMDISWLSRRHAADVKDQEQFLNKTKSMLELVDATIQLVQKITAELRPGLLDDLGLVPAIEWQLKDFENRTKIKCQTKIECSDLNLTPDQSTAIFRVFQEALTNVARHAEATQVDFLLHEKSGNLILTITDNGMGIEEFKVNAPGSLGFMGMRERLRPFNGELEVHGAPREGTMVSITFPLNKAKADD